MDPRHPELVLPRVKELVSQLEQNFDEIKTSTVRNRMSQLERKGALIVQEICLTAPRLHETLMSVARQRRGELARGVQFEQPTVKENQIVEKPTKKKTKKAKK